MIMKETRLLLDKTQVYRFVFLIYLQADLLLSLYRITLFIWMYVRQVLQVNANQCLEHVLMSCLKSPIPQFFTLLTRSLVLCSPT